MGRTRIAATLLATCVALATAHAAEPLGVEAASFSPVREGAWTLWLPTGWSTKRVSGRAWEAKGPEGARLVVEVEVPRFKGDGKLLKRLCPRPKYTSTGRYDCADGRVLTYARGDLTPGTSEDSPGIQVTGVGVSQSTLEQAAALSAYGVQPVLAAPAPRAETSFESAGGLVRLPVTGWTLDLPVEKGHVYLLAPGGNERRFDSVAIVYDTYRWSHEAFALSRSALPCPGEATAGESLDRKAMYELTNSRVFAGPTTLVSRDVEHTFHICLPVGPGSLRVSATLQASDSPAAKKALFEISPVLGAIFRGAVAGCASATEAPAGADEPAVSTQAMTDLAQGKPLATPVELSREPSKPVERTWSQTKAFRVTLSVPSDFVRSESEHGGFPTWRSPKGDAVAVGTAFIDRCGRVEDGNWEDRAAERQCLTASLASGLGSFLGSVGVPFSRFEDAPRDVELSGKRGFVTRFGGRGYEGEVIFVRTTWTNEQVTYAAVAIYSFGSPKEPEVLTRIYGGIEVE